MFPCHDFLGFTQSRICPKLSHRHAKCWLKSYICSQFRLISSWWFRIIFADRMTSSNLSKWSGILNANLIKLSHQFLFPKHDILKGRWDREISRHFWYRYRYSPLYYWASWQCIVLLNHFPHHWPLVRGIHKSAVDSPRKNSQAEPWCCFDVTVT